MIVQGKLITIWSTRGNMGNTFTAINLAKKISEMSEKSKTILVDFNLTQPRISNYLEMEDMNHTIDNLYPFASGQNLSGDIIEANCEKYEKLFVLKGTLNPSFTDFIKPEILENIIQVLKDNFNNIILDVHSSLNNSGTYVALKQSDYVYTMLHRDLMSILSLNDIKPFLLSAFDKDKFKILFNKGSKKIYIPLDEITKSLNMESIGELPYISNSYNLINKGEFKNIVKEKDSKEYFNTLDTIIQEQKLILNPTKNKKKLFFFK